MEEKKVLTLKRFLKDDGTRGVFVLDGLPLCLSYELPWAGNQHEISCIPENSIRDYYSCSWEEHEHFPAVKMVARVNGVPGRSGILIHPGNKLSDIKGCILPGKSFRNRGFIEYSTASLDKLGTALSWQPFLLRIE